MTSGRWQRVNQSHSIVTLTGDWVWNEVSPGWVAHYVSSPTSLEIPHYTEWSQGTYLVGPRTHGGVGAWFFDDPAYWTSARDDLYIYEQPGGTPFRGAEHFVGQLYTMAGSLGEIWVGDDPQNGTNVTIEGGILETAIHGPEPYYYFEDIADVNYPTHFWVLIEEFNDFNGIFSDHRDYVDFNSLRDQQATSVENGVGYLNALEGSDEVLLPSAQVSATLGLVFVGGFNGGTGDDRLVLRDLQIDLNGGQGSDELVGGTFADVMNGGRGSDEFWGNGGADRITGGNHDQGDVDTVHFSGNRADYSIYDTNDGRYTFVEDGQGHTSELREIEQIRFDSVGQGHLSIGSLYVELAQMALHVYYDPERPGLPDSAWRPLHANDLGLPTRSHAGDPQAFQLVNGLYQTTTIWGGVNYLAAAEAFTTNYQGQTTLALSFRGTDPVWADGSTGWLPGLMDAYYEFFRPYIDAVLDFINEQNIQQVVVTGHSLGGAMVEMFLRERGVAGDPRFIGVTFGAPGTTAGALGALDERLLEFRHAQDLVGSLRVGHVGEEILIPYNNVPGLIDDVFWTYEHDMGRYVESVLGLSQLPFGQSVLIDPIFNGSPFNPAYSSRVRAGDQNDNSFGGDRTFVGILEVAIHDRLYGLGGNDILYGYAGQDRLFGGTGQDRLFGGLGADFLYGEAGDDFLSGGPGRDHMDGGDGQDTVSYLETLGGVTVDLVAWANNTGDAFGDTYAGIENLEGTRYADTLSGDDGANIIYGGLGDDRLSGGLSDDVLYGGQNADILLGGDGNDGLFGGEGNDTLTGGAGGDLLDGGNGIDAAQYDTATGGVAVDLNSGVSTGHGTDTLLNIENLLGSRFGDDLRGSIGANELRGGQGADTLYGRGGSDILIGGAGADHLYGGAGADTFVFYPGMGQDTVHDFSVSEANEVIQLRGLLGLAGFASILSASTQVGSNTVITFDADDSITLVNVLRSSLTADDFSFFA